MLARKLLRAVAITAFAAHALSAAAADRPEIGKWGIDLDGLSKTVKPGDDFHRFVNEAWLESATIPTGFPAYSDFERLALVNEARVRDIIDELLKTPQPPGSTGQQIADMYRAYADEERRNALGMEPIRKDLDAVLAARTRADLIALMTEPWQAAPIAAGVTIDSADPTRYLPGVVQSGLGLPDREYYLDEGEAYDAIRTAYRSYIGATLERGGIAGAAETADGILALETKIAKLHWSRAETRDPVKMYRPMTVQEISAYAPGFDWKLFFGKLRFDAAPVLVVNTDSAIQGLANLFAETPIETWRAYLAFHLLDGWADSLSEDWQKAHFEFHDKLLMGVAERRPARDRAIEAVNFVFGAELGRLYVAKWFPAQDRDEVQKMVGYVRDTFRDRIGRLAWMDDQTRTEALAKLEKVVSHIGYPDRWQDRSSIVIRPGDLAGNLKRLMEWGRQDEWKRLGEKRRDWQWPYKAHEVNAGYSPSLNSITFPAGILQAPFFDPAADAAVNFGAIAAVIGHEFGHGFDDQGSRSDGDGRLRDWWTPKSRQEFERRTAGLVDQFNQYEPVPGLKINGRQNLGETIGDLGGLSIAYDAYRRYVQSEQAGQAPVLDGFTGDQRFFMAWAQVWRSKVTEAEERRRVLSDNHSAGQFRTNGTLRNVDAWYEAFGVKPGDALYLEPAQRVRIW